MNMCIKKPVHEDIRQFMKSIHLLPVHWQFQCSGMLRKLGGIQDRDSVEDESDGADVFQPMKHRSLDGHFEGGNVPVSGNFDYENMLIRISQDPAVNVEKIRVRHG